MTKTMFFRLTEEHCRLLKRMWVEWDDSETGAPAIDPKRPYGNSDVAGDVHEILTGEMVDGDHVVLTRERREACLTLHRETETALQVVLRVGAFDPGDYECDQYLANWRRAT